MSFTDDYLAEKKKKKKTTAAKTGHSFTDEYLSEREKRQALQQEEDIAPVRTVTAPTKKAEDGERTWFTKGALEDGVTVGNVALTILGTATDILEEAGAGILGMGEKAVDAGAYLVGGAGKLFGADDFAEDTKEFIKKDLYDERKVAQNILSGGMADEFSVLGEKSDALVQSGGQYLVAAGLNMVGVPYKLTMGVSAFGSEVENAFRNGATYGEAGVDGAIAAGAEVLMGELFKIPGVAVSGSGRIGSGLVGKLSKNMSSTATKNLLNWAVSLGGEGVEEVATSFIQRLGQALTYEKEDTLAELAENEEAREKYVGHLAEKLFGKEAREEYGEALVGGMAFSGIVGAPGTYSASKAGVDLATGLNANEQKVVNKEVENRIAKEESGGKKLTNKEKDKIFDDVIEDMKKGYISTDTIEEVLGGDTYQNYQNAVKNEDSLRETFNQLNQMKQGEMTGEQIDLRNELKEKLKELETTNERGQLKSRLGNEVMSLVQGDRLMESYNERSRRGQAFEADLTKYNENQKAVVQKAIDSGILNNTRRTHEFVDMIAKISADKGVLFDFANNQKLKDSGFAIDGKTVNGFVTKDGVTLNIDSAKSLNSVVGHEITHVLEGTELYTELQSVLKSYAETKGEYQSRYDALTKLYEGIEGADVDAELTADLVGDYLFTDADFINHLSTNNRNVFQKMYDEIKYLYKVATAGSKEAKQLLEVKRAFENAFKATKNTADISGVKYSLNSNAKDELHKALYDTKYRDEVLLRDVSPAIMVSQKGVKNLPMSMKSSHIRENVFTEDEAKKLGLKVDEHTHYHGLGEEFFLKVIDGLDNVKLAYRGTKNATDPARRENYFLLVSEFKDHNGNTVNVPVYIDERSQINHVFIDVNKISTVFGRDAFNDYINRQIQNGDLVRIKNRDIQTSERDTLIVPGYGEDISNKDNVAQEKEGVKRSLSEQGEAPVYGNYNVSGKDIALEAPVTAEEVAVAENATTMFPDDLAPMEDDDGRFESLTDEDAPPETEAPYSESEDVTVDDPFENRDWGDVSNRKVNAYMYENPEVKPIFQEEAAIMLDELQNTTKGERWYNDHVYYESGGEAGFGGTKRYTSESIARMRDEWDMSYADIEKGLRAIIEDHGAENIAAAKKVEFMLNERLLDGYKSFVGYEPNMDRFGRVPPNQAYLELLNEKQITEYSKEAFDAFMANADSYAPPVEDVTPVRTAPTVEEDIAPTFDAQPRRGVLEGQQAMFEEPEVPKKITRAELHQSIVEDIKSRFKAKGFDFDKVLKNAKNLSTFSTVDNTPQRVMEKALGYKEGQVLSDLTVNQVAQNETEGIQWLNSFTDRKNGLLAQISKQYHIKPGSKESAAAQMYAEGFYVGENNDIIAYGDAELAKDFPDAQVQANIKGLARDQRIRQIYDDTLAMINESRTRNAYPEIPRLDNYFLHFRAMDDTFSRLGLPFNPNDIRAKDLPTDLNGVTADLKPGQPYFASAMHRTGKRTSFDLLGGLERYLSSAKNQIYHIDDIQTLRALRNYIADTYGQANGLENLDTLTEEEAQERIKEVYGAHLSTFAKFLNEEANVLAGKTALIDRGLEGIIGRRGITFLDTLNKQVGSNMVGFNVSSSLTNFLPVAQTFAKGNKAAFVKAFAQTAAHKISGRSDGFVENSPVMIRRHGADRFYRTPWQKVGDAGYSLMGVVDDISTELIARTKYNELVSKGMDSQKAHIETDKWVSRLMGDRSLGQQPQLYNSKMLGLVTKFQLEVRNQLDSQFYDTIQETKVSNEHIQNELARNAKTAAKVASTFVQLAAVQHLFGQAFESVAGYNPAFDIIEVLMTAFGFDDDEESEDTVLDNLEQGFLALLEDLPYASTFLDGGRIPISSALPVAELVKGEDEWGNEKSRWKTLGEIAPYYGLPTGYGQIKKTAKGLDMFSDDHPIAGSYTNSGNLRFPVEDTLASRVKAGVFGQYASENARDYFDNERNALKEKQIQEFIDVEMPIRDYWDYREGLNKQDTLEDKFDYIAGLDLSVEQKNILINNVVDRKDKVDMENYDDFSGYEEFDFYSKNPEKYEFLQSNGVSYEEYKSSDDAKEEYDAVYSWYKNYPEKVTVAKAVTDNMVEYRRYTSYLNDIRADKDANGETINGTGKAKKADYINSLDLDYGQKIILYRSLFESSEDKRNYNADIVEYLNGRDDISYDEMVTILEELDMKVDSDGNVTW